MHAVNIYVTVKRITFSYLKFFQTDVSKIICEILIFFGVTKMATEVPQTQCSWEINLVN